MKQERLHIRDRFSRRFGLLPLAFVLLTATANAAPFVVTNSSDNGAGSLRQAILSAAAEDEIVFQIPTTDAGYSSTTGVYTITLTSGQLLIDKDLTITGLGARVLTVDGHRNDRIFQIAAGKTVSISGLTITNGKAPGSGGGTYKNGGGIDNGGNLTLTSCSIDHNFAGETNADSSSGGGIYCEQHSSTTLVGCAISSNTAQGNAVFGGGIYTGNYTTISATNCTFSGNLALVLFQSGSLYNSADGGAIYNAYLAALTLTNCTIAGNMASAPGGGHGGRGGGIWSSTGQTFDTINSIIAANSASDSSPDVDGPVASEGHNLIGNVDGSSGWISSLSDPNHDFLGGTTSATALDPQLESLANNGGPTSTMVLKVTSPAIDKGSDAVTGPPRNLAIDQRLLPRKQGDHVDIGAFEFDPPVGTGNFVVTTTDEHNDGVCGGADCTLLEAVNAANANSDANTITFAPGVTGTIRNSLPAGLMILHPVTIFGPGARVVTVDGKKVARLLNIAKDAGDVNISGLTFTQGKSAANESGGACYNRAKLTLSDCDLSSSFSSVHGGAIYNDGSNGTATLSLVNCTVFGNAGESSGGAIFNAAYNGSTTTTLTNCTFAGNSVEQYGGAIYNDGTSSGNASLTITNCTFDQNEADLGASGIYNDAKNPSTTGTASVILRNTLFLQGAAGANLVNDTAPGGGGTITSQGSNLSSDDAGAGNSGTGPGGFLNSPGDIRNTDPKLDNVLKDNGGKTDTVALLVGSPAINAGKDALAPPADQRGYLRIGVSDIGAFEFGGTSPSPTPTATATPTATGTPTATPMSTPTPTAAPGILNNISTRLQVGTGENVLFAGFTIQGTGSKKVIIRAAGPSLTQFGVAGALGNPQLELHDSSNTIATNDNWQTTQIGGVITADQSAEIQSSGFAPADPAESAIIATLPPGAYTAIVQGVGGGTGVGIVEVYDLSQNNGANLTNISTRGFVQLGDSVLIGGFTVTNQPVNVIVEASGPSLKPFGVGNAMDNPQLELHDANGTIAANDDWQTTQIGGVITGDQSGAIQQSGLAPSNPAESALIARLSPGGYTAIMHGANNTSGVGVIAIYTLP
jgi:hypothetical protein